MYPRFKTNLIGLAVALSFILVGFGLGEPPHSQDGQIQAYGQVGVSAESHDAIQAPAFRRSALMRHLAMPYVSFAALTPRQES